MLSAERPAEALPHFERAVQLQPASSSHHTLLRYARARNDLDHDIAVDVDMIELGAYDEDFVRRSQRLSQPPV